MYVNDFILSLSVRTWEIHVVPGIDRSRSQKPFKESVHKHKSSCSHTEAINSLLIEAINSLHASSPVRFIAHGSHSKNS